MINIVKVSKETFNTLNVSGKVVAVYEEIQSGDLRPITFAQVSTDKVVINDAPYKNVRVMYEG